MNTAELCAWRITELERQNTEIAADALNTILWLYRRLPRGYGRPPAVERSINALAAKTGTEVAAFLEERDDSHTANSAAHQEGVNLATQGREGQ